MKESMDIKTLEEAFERIYNIGGKEVLCSPQLLGYFSDIAPTLKRYRNIIKCFVNIKGNEILFNAAMSGTEKQKAEMLKIVQELQEEYFLEKNICIEVCQAFYSAIGVEKIVFEEKNSIQQYTGDEINRREDRDNKEKKNNQKKEECVAQESIQNKNDSININNITKQKKQEKNKILVILLIIVALLFVGIEYFDVQKEKDRSSIEYENSKYSVGDIVEFGKYTQDSDGTEEPIEWIILKVREKKALVISKYALELRKYHEKNENVTWESSDTRKWINTEFYNKAFDSQEQNMIENTTVKTEDNFINEAEGGNDTKDKIFLLSIEQADTLFSKMEDREAEGTEYVKQIYGVEDRLPWLLRSPGSYQNKVAFVESGGAIYERGNNVSEYYGGIRPALWINFR